MTIIAICGFSGSGKDTTADILVNKYGYIKLNFAAAVKDILSIIFGWNREMLEGSTVESRKEREIVDEWWSKELNIPNLTPRMMMQQIATNVFRDNFHQDIWLKIVERKLTRYPNVVITDCRFPNEISMVKSYGCKLIFIERNKPIWFDSYKQGIDCEESSKLHSSETSWIRSEFNYVLDNNGTLEDLERNLNTVLNLYN